MYKLSKGAKKNFGVETTIKSIITDLQVFGMKCLFAKCIQKDYCFVLLMMKNTTNYNETN